MLTKKGRGGDRAWPQRDNDRNARFHQRNAEIHRSIAFRRHFQ